MMSVSLKLENVRINVNRNMSMHSFFYSLKTEVCMFVYFLNVLKICKVSTKIGEILLELDDF